jgi:hypothetical protein
LPGIAIIVNSLIAISTASATELDGWINSEREDCLNDLTDKNYVVACTHFFKITIKSLLTTSLNCTSFSVKIILLAQKMKIKIYLTIAK